MATVKSQYRKYSKMYYDCVFMCCMFANMRDKGLLSNKPFSFYMMQADLLLKLMRTVRIHLPLMSDQRWCTQIDRSFENGLLEKLTKNGVDHSYYFEL